MIWVNHLHTPANVNPSENSINIVQRSAHRKKMTISLPTSTLKLHTTLDFDAYAYFHGTSAYVPDPTIVHMSDQFIQFLQLLLDIAVFPPLLKDYLELGQMHQPYLLVNAFGRDLKTLARRLCGLSPSFFFV